MQSRSWKTEDGHNRSIVEIKARRIQFLNKRMKVTETGQEVEDEEPSTYTDDSFDKFLASSEGETLDTQEPEEENKQN